MDISTQAIDTKLNGFKIEGMQELQAMRREMVGLIKTASVPILAVNVDGMVNGWNTKIADSHGQIHSKKVTIRRLYRTRGGNRVGRGRFLFYLTPSRPTTTRIELAPLLPAISKTLNPNPPLRLPASPL
ncbi:hypothetical protein Ahy_A03g012144 [Arachis hypogaea]|uniref:PAS domain-containing protein n=1 Tax=Arachis hypogaea TaxID=3818 RepID=A0A445DSM9_ARAHY|nr:hypothetical protein Ahy_A03g012144 [Arachis hypogaea]